MNLSVISEMTFIMIKPNAISKLEPEHLGITPLTGKKIKSAKEGAVYDHIFHTGHYASFDNFKTLAKESDEFRLLLRESLLIVMMILL